jgi:flagellar hook-associated protein 1 FlgK
MTAMSDINGILNIGRTSLMTHKKAIEVTSNNIANVNTPGYSRQRVHFSSTGTLSPQSGFYAGSGVTIGGIDRVHDRYLDVQISNENDQLGRWEARQNAMQRVEILFNELSGTGLNDAMSQFWNAWQDLANNPSGSSERSLLTNKAESLAITFNNLKKDLNQIRNDTASKIESELGRINQISRQIAGLNEKIVNGEAVGDPVHELQDERDLLISDLSEMIDINSFENANGSLNVSLKSGLSLVNNLRSYELGTQPNAVPGGTDDVVWLDAGGNGTVITDRIMGGKLKGLIEVRDEVIPGYLGQLDDLAGEMISSVNGIHASGYGLDGSQNDFFTGTSAGDIALNEVVAGDPDKIAAAGPTDGLPGGNGNAIAMAELQHNLTMNGNRNTFSEFYNALVGDVGRAVEDADTQVEHQSTMLQHLGSYRESVSGVSLDEEMINLMNYQSAYEAAAKLIQTADELLQTVIDMF